MHNEAVDEPTPPQRGYWERAVTELEIYAVSSILVLYALACGWTFVSAAQGTVSETQAVAAVITLGLIAPVCSWALRRAISLQGKQSTRAAERGALSGVPGLLLARWRGREQRSLRSMRWPGRRNVSATRAADIGIAVVSVALFWAFYAGSLLAALLVPLAVHWLRWNRRRFT